MAMPNGIISSTNVVPNGVPNVVPKSQIEAILSVPPHSLTEPRHVLKVSSKDPMGSSIFKAALHIVFFCAKGSDEDEAPGWAAAGWIFESLSRALEDQPLLSGRLRRGEDGDGDLEIVSNDSGARLFEGTIDVTLEGFLGLEDVHKAESQLVYWKDIDEKNPEFSPLFYVQVTNFQCGGYSIGITCSMFLADAIIMDNFLQKWAKIHREIVPKSKDEKTLPIFYLPNLKAPSVNLNGRFPSTTRERDSQTIIYKINTTTKIEDLKDNVATICLKEAEKKLGNGKISSEFVLMVKESSNVIKVHNLKKGEFGKSHLKNGFKLNSSNLKEYMGLNEVSFSEGNKPITVSYWVGSGDVGVHAIAIPSYDKVGDVGDLSIIVITSY
ncbi:HXXXD-type acyl-transferase family protein [Euphorbia peplus]|nr:HXXXD-type acyl-transferase family protein [Euphorbia peplus]